MIKPKRKLIPWEYAVDTTRISEEVREKVLKDRQEIRDILTGKSTKKLLIVGPCSMDFRDPIIEYATRLKKISQKVEDKIFIIMRAYSSKPRTTVGWKGMQFSGEFGSSDVVSQGLLFSRKLMIEILETGLAIADELLYPSRLGFFEDLVSYFAIGARSSENQSHREISSLLDIPVGLKNPTSGDLVVAVNSIIAARSPQHITFGGYEYDTVGNPYSHIVLRGSTFEGDTKPNYQRESMEKLKKILEAKGLKSKVIVDLNHDNSGKKYEKQPEILEDVFHQDEDDFIAGFMCESYLLDGNQKAESMKIEDIIRGKSITDPCLGIEKTEEMIMKLYGKLKEPLQNSVF